MQQEKIVFKFSILKNVKKEYSFLSLDNIIITIILLVNKKLNFGLVTKRKWYSHKSNLNRKPFKNLRLFKVWSLKSKWVANLHHLK